MDNLALALKKGQENVVIVDTLSFCRAGRNRTIEKAITMITKKHPNAIIILVIKTQNDNDDYTRLSDIHHNVVIIRCNDAVYVAQNGTNKSHPLAEADDHMIHCIIRAIALTGCLPIHIGFDKYRNANYLDSKIPSYPFYVSYMGCVSKGVMIKGSIFTKELVIRISRNSPRLQCNITKIAACINDGQILPCCEKCGMCIICRLKLVMKYNLIVSQALKYPEHKFQEKANHCIDFECT